MGNHHDNHHSEGQKPVSFTVPFLLATVTLIAMLLLLSLCDPKHGHHGKCECKEGCSKECMEACEKGDHGHHDANGHETKDVSHAEEHAATPAVAADSVKAESHDHADTTHKAAEHAH
ncbi:MAG: hypothetical protein K0S26_3475 [Bacteroidota bacterium]|jgi:hypothetical protein|nr:hypothetical protein [Bacteroidota bacterium]MDF2453971.1 hypothetical protein [Bacteroidota bacterium]